MDEEILMIKGELHYVWPQRYRNGNQTMCYQCRYFVPDEKTKDLRMKTGECHSKAHQTERGYSHRQNGWDKTADVFGCKWWFPIDRQPGEQGSLL